MHVSSKGRIGRRWQKLNHIQKGHSSKILPQKTFQQDMDFVALEMINILVFRAQRGQRSSSAPVREEKHVFASKNSRHTLLILLKQQGQKQMAFAFPCESQICPESIQQVLNPILPSPFEQCADEHIFSFLI